MKNNEKQVQKTLEEERERISKTKFGEKINYLKKELEAAKEEIEALRKEDDLALIQIKKSAKSASVNDGNGDDLRQAIKLILHNTFACIERELSVQRIADIALLNSENLVIRCTICARNKAIIECSSASEYVCRNCYFNVQAKLNFTDNSVNILPFISNSVDLELEKQIKKPMSGAQSQSEISNENVNQVVSSQWKKFEQFSFVLNTKSQQHDSIKKAFSHLYQLYVNLNGITPDNGVRDFDKFMRLPKKLEVNKPKKESEGLDCLNSKQSLPSASNTRNSLNRVVFDTELNREVYDSYIEFANCNYLNTEEKIFMNKAAYFVFKRNGARTKYEDFLKVVKSIQVRTDYSIEFSN